MVQPMPALPLPSYLLSDIAPWQRQEVSDSKKMKLMKKKFEKNLKKN